MKHARTLTLAMMMSATCLTHPALAQTDTTPVAPAADQLEEITVTARKSSENLQSVPIAITALGADTLSKANAQTIRDIATLTPGLSISGDGSGRGNQPSIRGLSFTGDSSTEGNVAVMLDGAYISNPASMSLGMMDFERVEVVKGPQSALYGRNAFAGAINYVSKAPPTKLEAAAELRVGTHSTDSGKFSLGGPVIENLLSVRGGFIYDHAGGTFQDAVNGKDIGGWEKYDANLTARITPSDRLTFDLGFYYGHDTYGRPMQSSFAANCGAVNALTGLSAAYCGQAPSGKDTQLVASTFEPGSAVGNAIRVKHGRAKATYKLDGAKIELSGSYFDVRQRTYTELFGTRDGLPFILAATATQPTQTVNLVGFSGGSFNNKDYSADFRVSSDQDKRLRWAFGAYYFKTDKDQLTTLGFNSSPIPAGRRLAIGAAQGAPLQSAALINLVNLWLTPTGDASSLIGVVKSHNQQASAFGSLAFDITEQLTVSAEARYTNELKKSNVLSLATALGVDPDGPNGQRARFKYWNPRFTVNYKLGDNHLFYGSVAKGTKSGGFNQAAVSSDELSYNPENNWTYEIGLKNTLFDRRVHLNIAAFYVDWTNLQILVPSAVAVIGSVIKNYGSVKARGGEAELQARLFRGVTLNTGVAFTDPKFGNDTFDFAAPNIAVCRLVASCAGRITTTTVPGVATPVTAISLNKLVRNQVSRWQVTAGLNIDRPLAGDWNWFGAANYKYESSQFSQVDDIRYVGPRNTLSLQAGVQRDQMRITIWAMNALNDLTPFAATAGQGITRYNGTGSIPKEQLPEQRRIGMSFGYSF